MATENQKIVFAKVVAKKRKGAKVSVSAEMHPPYSKRFAEHPDRLKKSKGWEELMEQYLPDKLLGKKHRELLEVPKKVRTFIKGDLSTEYEELDSNAVKAGLDMAYKLKGKYAPEKHDVTSKGEKVMAINYIKPDEIKSVSNEE